MSLWVLLPEEQVDEEKQGPAPEERHMIHGTVNFDWAELWEKVCGWFGKRGG